MTPRARTSDPSSAVVNRLQTRNRRARCFLARLPFDRSRRPMRSIFAPALSRDLAASRTCPPVVSTSSTIMTVSPGLETLRSAARCHILSLIADEEAGFSAGNRGCSGQRNSAELGAGDAIDIGADALAKSLPSAARCQAASRSDICRFTLRSGRKSNYYLDKYRFETQPDILQALGRLFAERGPRQCRSHRRRRARRCSFGRCNLDCLRKPCLFVQSEERIWHRAADRRRSKPRRDRHDRRRCAYDRRAGSRSRQVSGERRRKDRPHRRRDRFEWKAREKTSSAPVTR